MTNRPVPIFQLKFCQSQWYSKVKLWRHFSILWLPMSVFEVVYLPVHILKCSSYRIQIVIKQEYAFCYFKYRFDKWRWRKLTFWRNTVMHWRIILKIRQNALSRVCTSELTWHLLIFIEHFFLMEVPRGDVGVEYVLRTPFPCRKRRLNGAACLPWSATHVAWGKDPGGWGLELTTMSSRSNTPLWPLLVLDGRLNLARFNQSAGRAEPRDEKL